MWRPMLGRLPSGASDLPEERPEVTEGGACSHRLHVRLPARTAADLLARAASQGLTVSATARQLIRLGLDQEHATDSTGSGQELLTLSALVAAEHAVLMVASILPEGERRMHSLAERAAQAAERRLARVRDSVSATAEEDSR